jgi:hypothetical protein
MFPSTIVEYFTTPVEGAKRKNRNFCKFFFVGLEMLILAQEEGRGIGPAFLR